MPVSFKSSSNIEIGGGVIGGIACPHVWPSAALTYRFLGSRSESPEDAAEQQLSGRLFIREETEQAGPRM